MNTDYEDEYELGMVFAAECGEISREMSESGNGFTQVQWSVCACAQVSSPDSSQADV